MANQAGFSVVFRGYDREQVDALLSQAARVLATGSTERRKALAANLEQPGLAVVLRGYDRAQVDDRLAQIVAQLTTD